MSDTPGRKRRVAGRIKAVKGLRLWQVLKKKKKKKKSERLRCGVCGGIKSPEGKLLSSRRNAIMVEPRCKSLELILRPFYTPRLRFLLIVPFVDFFVIPLFRPAIVVSFPLIARIVFVCHPIIIVCSFITATSRFFLSVLKYRYFVYVSDNKYVM